MPELSWNSVALREDVRIVVTGTMPALADDVAAEVAAIWNAERALHPSLFNGRVFCADDVACDRIGGHWTEYRRVLAQLRHPALFARLRLRALAVNGLLECAEGLVLGLRSADAIYLPGCWQAAPAGSVEARDGDALDPGRQLLAKLEEELGLDAADIDAMRPVAAIEHAGTHVMDVGFLLRTSLSFEAIEARRAARGNAEYQALRLVAPDGIAAFEREAGPTLLASARILMTRWSAG